MRRLFIERNLDLQLQTPLCLSQIDFSPARDHNSELPWVVFSLNHMGKFEQWHKANR